LHTQQELLDLGADANYRTIYCGWRPIHYAAWYTSSKERKKSKFIPLLNVLLYMIKLPHHLLRLAPHPLRRLVHILQTKKTKTKSQPATKCTTLYDYATAPSIAAGASFTMGWLWLVGSIKL